MRAKLALALAAAVALALALADAHAQPAPVDGCSESLYLDRTAAGADRTFNWDYSFANDPERCIMVRVGQTVTWQGNFGDHPLDADEGDAPNPIAGHNGGAVVFTRAGTFGFRCNFHLSMRGAIRVLPAPAVVPWAGPYAQTTLLAILLLLGVFGAREALRSGAVRALLNEDRARPEHWLAALVLLAAALGLALALGPALHGAPDSATYLSAAEHLVRGDGYVISSLDERGRFEPLACFAPLFSLLIALLMIVQQLSAREAVGDAVLLSFLIYALACYTMLRVVLPSGLRRWCLPLALYLVCLPGSVTCLRSALSDLLGAGLVLFACAHVLAHLDLLRHGNAVRSGALFALAVWARWPNLHFALAACVGIVLAARPLPMRRRLHHALTIGATFTALVGPLWLRNLLLAGNAMGARSLSLSHPLSHVRLTLMGLAQPLIEVGRGYRGFALLPELYVAMIIACGAGVASLWLRRREAATDLGLLLALGYVALLITSSSSTRLDEIDHPRFWLPVSPLVLGLSLRAIHAAREPSLQRPLAVLGSCLVALTTAHAALDVARQSGHVSPKSGLFAQHLTSSHVVHTALELFDAGRCALSSPHAFWLFPQLGTRPIHWSTEASSRALSAQQPRCVLVLRERADFNTDSARFHSYFEQLAETSRARLLARDAHAELWWAGPAAPQYSAQRL